MYSVLIRGMEMPNNCMECPCSGTYKDGLWVCEIKDELLTSTELNDEKPGWCPLIAIPDHGRLIDADDVDTITVICNERGFLKAIDAPIIVSADKEEENA